MDYVIILFAVFCFAGQFAFTKVFEKTVNQTLATSLVMLVITNLAGALLLFAGGGFKASFSLPSVILAIIFALIMIPYYVIGIKVLSLGSLALYGMFMMLGGMVVPFLYGIVFLREQLSVGKCLGTVLLTVFIVLQAVWQNSQGDVQKEVTKAQKTLFFILCLAVFFINGMTGVIAKIHQVTEGTVDEVSFTVLSCALTALFSLVLFVFKLPINPRVTLSQAASAIRAKPILTMVFIGASAYIGNFLHLLAANSVPASVQFPLVSGGVIILSALVSFFVFKERVSKKEWLVILGAFLSTFFFAF